MYYEYIILPKMSKAVKDTIKIDGITYEITSVEIQGEDFRYRLKAIAATR